MMLDSPVARGGRTGLGTFCFPVLLFTFFLLLFCLVLVYDIPLLPLYLFMIKKSRTRKVRANDKPFVTQEVRKAMMKTSQMEKVYCRLPNGENKIKYKKQKNSTKRLCRREKKNFIKKSKPRQL